MFLLCIGLKLNWNKMHALYSQFRIKQQTVHPTNFVYRQTAWHGGHVFKCSSCIFMNYWLWLKTRERMKFLCLQPCSSHVTCHYKTNVSESNSLHFSCTFSPAIKCPVKQRIGKQPKKKQGGMKKYAMQIIRRK